MFSKDGRQADATYFSNRWSSSQHSTFSFFSKWGFVFQGPVTYFQLTHTQELTTLLKFLPKIKTNSWSYFSFALRKVWCEKLLQSSSFIYRKKRRVKNRTKQGDESILYSLHIFFKDILQLKSKCLFFYVSSFAFRFTFLSKHRWWLLKYLKAI